MPEDRNDEMMANSEENIIGIDQSGETIIAANESIIPEAVASPAVEENKAEPAKRFPRRDNRTFKSGPSGSYDSKDSRHSRFRKKICRFCLDKKVQVSYRDSSVLGNYITERGKILPRRITGTCAKHQRDVSRAIKRARILSIMPFTVK
jgi:small subunit ribosomal protein S18